MFAISNFTKNFHKTVKFRMTIREIFMQCKFSFVFSIYSGSNIEDTRKGTSSLLYQWMGFVSRTLLFFIVWLNILIWIVNESQRFIIKITYFRFQILKNNQQSGEQIIYNSLWIYIPHGGTITVVWMLRFLDCILLVL